MNLLLTTCQNERTEWEKLLKGTRNNSLEVQPKVKAMSWGGMGNLWDDMRQISIKEILLIKWWYSCLKIAIPGLWWRLGFSWCYYNCGQIHYTFIRYQWQQRQSQVQKNMNNNCFIIKHLIKKYYNKQIGKVNIYINLGFFTVMYFEYVCACVCRCACVSKTPINRGMITRCIKCH